MKRSVRSCSSMSRATRVAGVSNVPPPGFSCVISSIGVVLDTTSVPTDLNSLPVLNAVTPPSTNIRISGSRCSHGRRKNASRMLSMTRRVKPSGSALVSALTRARPRWSVSGPTGPTGPGSGARAATGGNDTARRTRGRSIWRFEPTDAASDDLGAEILESHSGRGGSRIRERARPDRPPGGALPHRAASPITYSFTRAVRQF